MSGSSGTKSVWTNRLQLLESVNLVKVAAELTERRTTKYRTARLEAGDDPNVRLPDDLRASAKAMKETLIALHKVLGNRRTKTVRQAFIEDRLSGSKRTVRRRLRDLADLHIIEKKGESDLRTGGRGPSSYRISWATVKDIALSQGFQLQLFGDLEFDDVDSTCGHNGLSTGQNGHTSGQNGHTSGQNGRSNIRARARQSGPQFGSEFGSSSPSPPQDDQRRDRGHSPAAADAEGEEGEGCNFAIVRQRLRRYGFRSPHSAIRKSRDNGCSPAEVLALVQFAEAHVIGGVQAWPPEALWFRIVNHVPGGAIEDLKLWLPVNGLYEREAVALKQRAKHRAKAEREEKLKQVRMTEVQREKTFGPILAALCSEEKHELLRRHGFNPFDPDSVVIQQPYNLLRLLELDAMQEASQHVEAGGGDGEPSRPEGL